MATEIQCPHCNKKFELNIGAVLGARKTIKKAASARMNGFLGGAPRVKNPVRLRPYHPSHPKHRQWLAEQAELKKLNKPEKL
jgi:pyruvate-formate lyase-activating enzyme